VSVFLIPVTNVPQSFNISLNGVNYNLVVKWNDADEAGWQMDITNADTDVLLVAGIPLITGLDCLAGLEYLGIGGKFIVQTDGNPDAVPTFENLGINSNLYFQTP
jgi:hypothetical protein